ncbi:MAG: molybdopterin-dependent oxidoreductase [Deltaproteobacteria bacterium]|nr:molybdopterin-dependent oxidoreductase [Deltaproteobacteria bacterium]
MMKTNKKQVIQSSCSLCHTGCGVLVHLEKGKVIKIEGNPDSPVNRGILCSKGANSLELLYHPDRLKHPLKRAGERGEGKWQRISWDEALDEVATEFIKARDKYGAESVALLVGSMKGIKDAFLHRLGSAFGTPNHAYSGHVCWVPGILSWRVTCGFFPLPDLEYPPACILNWGLDSEGSLIWMHDHIIRAKDNGAKLIVVDPRRSNLAEKADLWLRIRPGSDLALALSMIHVIINENLYDKDFIGQWAFGFEELKAHVQDYSPDKAEEITWIPAEKIVEAARLYAKNRPATTGLWGNALDTNINSFGAGRALAILSAITGNIDVPGGDCPRLPSGVLGRLRPETRAVDKLPPGQLEKRADAELRLIPLQPQITLESVMKAVLEEEPYPIKVLYLQATNILLTSPNSREVFEALKRVDFSVASELFMTPTAEMTDIVLPAGSYLEVDEIIEGGTTPVVSVQQKVVQIGECWSDYKILSNLAGRLELSEYFPEENDSLDAMLKPLGMTFDEFRNVGTINSATRYRRYETEGFSTPSGKVELYSDQLKEWGYDPLPIYRELPETPYSDPDLTKEFPLIFTNRKRQCYRHSQGRQIDALRSIHPEPVTEINSKTAENLGIKDDDWIYIENRRGRIKQKAVLTDDLDPRVVIVDYGWWYPEKGAEKLYGWDEANINILTSNEPPYNHEMGSCNMRGLLCKIYKA